MGDKISQLPSATTLAGTESVPVVQDGTTKKAAAALFKTTNAADLTSGTISNARLPIGNQSQVGALQIGTVAGTACDGADARLSNSRIPTGGAGGDLIGSYPNPVLTNTGVAAGIYGSATVVPQLTIDAKGRVSNAASVAIPIPQAAAATPLPTGTPSIGASDKFAREDHVHLAPSTTLTGDVTGSGTGSVSTTLANVPSVTPGTYGSSSRIPIVQVDSKGRVVSANTVPVSSAAGGTVTSVAADGGTTGLTFSGSPIVDAGTLSLDGTLGIANGGTGQNTASAALAALGGVPLSLVGVSSGVASLDASGLVPVSQLPNMVTGSYATLDGSGKVPLSQLYAGSASGLATLDGGGKVPSGQLPSYVDDVVEVANFAALPNPGETGKIYVTLDTNLTYRWSGSVYVEISAGPTPSSTTPLIAGTAAVGTSLTYARADHVHPTQAGSATPLVASGAGAVGTATLFAREDHVHPAQVVPAVSSSTPLVASGTGQIGSLTTYARADHVHPAQSVPTASSSTPIVASGSGAVGTSTNYARADHVHPAQTVTVSSVDGGSPSAVGVQVQLRRGTTASWTSANPVLASAEVGFDTSQGSFKIGDGLTAWNDLLFANAAGVQVNTLGYQVEYLIVAGGAGGAANWGSGGGAGGYRSSVVGESSGGGAVAESKVTIIPGTSYPVVIGAGGSGAAVGQNSSAFGITAIGGGFGGSTNGSGGSSGGSGGGGITGAGYAGTSGQGFAGGQGYATAGSIGGGGGAGAVGGAGSTTGGSASGVGGAGGAGVASLASGSSVSRAGGGGGGGTQSGGSGAGGAGGGGAGGGYTAGGTNGTANTGGGGGGGGANNGPGSTGGSGVVIVRYFGGQKATGGTVTSVGGYTIHTFTTSGTFAA